MTDASAATRSLVVERVMPHPAEKIWRALTQGPLIERHARFPEGVNAGYMQLLDRHRIALRVWERGAGETLSCGTGACAAVVAAIAQKRLDSPVEVQTRGGTLTISWAGGDNAVVMKGPAETVFDGTLEIKEP